MKFVRNISKLIPVNVMLEYKKALELGSIISHASFCHPFAERYAVYLLIRDASTDFWLKTTALPALCEIWSVTLVRRGHRLKVSDNKVPTTTSGRDRDSEVAKSM